MKTVIVITILLACSVLSCQAQPQPVATIPDPPLPLGTIKLFAVTNDSIPMTPDMIAFINSLKSDRPDLVHARFINKPFPDAVKLLESETIICNIYHNRTFTAHIQGIGTDQVGTDRYQLNWYSSLSGTGNTLNDGLNNVAYFYIDVIPPNITPTYSFRNAVIRVSRTEWYKIRPLSNYPYYLLEQFDMSKLLPLSYCGTEGQ